MEIHHHILNYLKGRPFTDENAEPQVKFNKMKLKIAEMANFQSDLNALPYTVNSEVNQARIDSLREISISIHEAMLIEFNNLSPIEVKVLPAEVSTYEQLSEKNKGKD